MRGRLPGTVLDVINCINCMLLILNHLKEIGKNLDNYSSKYDNFILLGDLNSEPTESAVRDFCQIYGCKNLIKDNTCFKNPEKPSCIDLIITNRPKSFQNSVTLETRLSDLKTTTLSLTFSNQYLIKLFQNTLQ